MNLDWGETEREAIEQGAADVNEDIEVQEVVVQNDNNSSAERGKKGRQRRAPTWMNEYVNPDEVPLDDESHFSVDTMAFVTLAEDLISYEEAIEH